MDCALVTETIVEFLMPGSFFPEEHTRKVEDRSVDNLDIPDGCYCFSFYDYTYAVVEGEKYSGKASNKSARYYVGGQVFSADELPKTKDFDILRSNMASNGWSKVIQCRTGNWQPFEDNDTLLTAPDKLSGS